MTCSPTAVEDRGNYDVYFRDSEECLRCLSHPAPSESAAREWFTRLGVAVVAIHAQARVTAA
jgi:hypothetical protein